MTKTTRITAAILICLLLLTAGAGLAMNCIAFSKMGEAGRSLADLRASVTELQTNVTTLQDDVSKLNTETEDVAQEDDVKIAGEYTIRSTQPISDAYRSGDTSALSDKEKETLDMASAVLAEIITDGMSDFEKEKAVYDWMTSHLAHDDGLLTVIPQTQADCDNPYGVLKFHNAVCVGYATTFRLFMQMLEIPCMVVHNSECFHSWDLTQLDGGWYHTDIYSDAGNGNYSHFNRTDVMQSQEQSWNTEFFPAADQYKYCYTVMTAQEESDIYHVPALLRKVLEERGNALNLHFDSSLDEVQAQIVQNMLGQIQDRLSNIWQYNDMSFDWNWIPVDDGFVLNIALSWYGDQPDVELPEDAYEKIDQAVSEAFDDLSDDGEAFEDTAEIDGEGAVG